MLRHQILLALFCLALPGSAQARDLAWTRFNDDRGASVEYPRRLLPVASNGTNENGRMFASIDGRTRLELFSISNARHEDPLSFTRRIGRNRELLAYDRVTRRFFAVSAIEKGRILYRRCNFVGAMIHCVDLRYPAAEKRAWDDVVTRISLSLRPR